jgi:hypothetical protein
MAFIFQQLKLAAPRPFLVMTTRFALEVLAQYGTTPPMRTGMWRIMTIRKLSHVFYLLTWILISLLVLFVVLRFFEQRELDDLRDLRDVRYASFLVADKLRQSSDDLSCMGQAYIDTGDTKFELFLGDTCNPQRGDRRTRSL